MDITTCIIHALFYYRAPQCKANNGVVLTFLYIFYVLIYICLSETELHDAMHMMQYHNHWNAAILIQRHFNSKHYNRIHLLMLVGRQQDYTLH